ncbi:hypothetical protein V6N11_020695 [Hibiscus sabdariffa]|uniref:Uncharacterized protein n=1 Tax=Hibiscus sabdariffa TaxID=183260 RepID=A0ABR2Q971_9ROSI
MMSSSREREDSSTFPTNPSSSSSPITVSDHLDSYLHDSTSYIGSAAGSYSNEGLLAAETASPSNSDVEFGFSRPDFRQQSPISGTVQFYERHVFLCYKSPSVWPPRIEAAEFDRLPRLLSAAVLARKTDMVKEDGFRFWSFGRTQFATFLDAILTLLCFEEVHSEWLPGTPEKLQGSFVFVCSHGSRDRRCGVCGPPLVSRFKEEIVLHGLQGRVSVSPCSHIGGHKYAGNVIIFGSNINGEVTGHWYGYVTPDDVPTLLEWHIGKGEIIDALWRGQMGLSEEEQKKCQELRRLANGETTIEGSTKEETQRQMDEMNTIPRRSQDELISCCQGNDSACCRDPALPRKSNIVDTDERAIKLTSEKKKVSDHLDSYLQDSTSYIGSAAGSYSNEGLLAAETASPSNSDVEFGFSRPDFRQQSPISGTVQFYERHVFLCYKSPSVWPPRIEAAEFDRLPRLLSAAVLARKTDMVKEVSVLFFIFSIWIGSYEGSDGARIQDLENAREQYITVITELDAAKQELRKVCQDCDASLEAKIAAFKQTEEAEHAAKVNMEKVGELSREISYVQESIGQVKLASLEAQQEQAKMFAENDTQEEII